MFFAVSLILLVAILGVCCYLPALTIFHDRSCPVTPGLFWIYTAIGIVGLGVLNIGCKALGVEPQFCAIPGLVLSAFGIRNMGRACLPRISIKQPDSAGAWFAIAASAIAGLYVLVPGLRMGWGSYPPVFFSVDSAYYLGQIHSLIQHSGWPPPSLSVSGHAPGYHYGSQSACAILSMLTGITPHGVAFAVCTPILQLAIIAGVWQMVARLAPGDDVSRAGWAVAFLLFCAFYPLADAWPADPSESGAPPISVFMDPQAFRGGFPMLSSLFGWFIALACMIGLQDSSRPAGRRLLVFLVGVVVIFKSPYFIVLGAGYGLWTLCEVRSLRQLSRLGAPWLALLLAAGLLALMKSTGAQALRFEPGQFFQARAVRMDTLGMFLILGLPGLVVLPFRGRGVRTRNAWLYLLCFCVPGLVFTNLFGLMRENEYSGDLFQLLAVFPLFVSAFTLSLVLGNGPRLPPLLRRSAIGLCVLAILPPLAHRGYQTVVSLVSPARGHEYVENKDLAQALARVPLKGTLLVTNDFHYPAQNNKRDLRQLQFPALFGHQMYAVNFIYERYGDSGRRLAEQNRFRQESWDPDLESLARTHGWTHLVICRSAPHAKDIPLPLVFQNRAYQVYAFSPHAK